MVVDKKEDSWLEMGLEVREFACIGVFIIYYFFLYFVVLSD